MKTLVIPDLHGRQDWKAIVNSQSFDMAVFLGDFLDSYDIPGKDQLENLADILAFKKENPWSVKLLIGNHDIHYFPGIEDSTTSGYQPLMAPTFRHLLGENKSLFQMAYQQEEFLFTHAGFAPTWLETVGIPEVELVTERAADTINDIWQFKPHSFLFRSMNGRSNPYGDDLWQSPVWIRPRSLMKDAAGLKKQLIQIVGHTQQNCIDIQGKSTGGRYYFVDTLPTSGEYLVIENESIKIGKV